MSNQTSNQSEYNTTSHKKEPNKNTSRVDNLFKHYGKIEFQVNVVKRIMAMFMRRYLLMKRLLFLS